MDKEKKSARELADMIALRMKVAAGLVSISQGCDVWMGG